tara:strand:+ start:7649 stop:10231 length:2583 start_codon:yes stop_codon:yes gene_type:complete
MSLRECINNANKEGIINDKKKADIQGHFESLEKDFISQGLSKSDAEREAGKATFDALKHEAAEKKRQAMLTLVAQARIKKFMQTFRNASGEEDPAEAMLAALAPNHRMPFSDLQSRYQTVRGQLYKRMTNYILKFKRNMTGGVKAKNEYMMDDVVREMFEPGSTGNPMARDLAEAASETMEFARLKFNAAGGRIQKLKKFGMPQMHDSILITKFTKKAWVNKVGGFDEDGNFNGKGMLNLDEMIDEKTGLKFNKGSLSNALEEVWETITTEGYNKLRPGTAAGFGKMIGNRRTDHRFLKFKDADTWLEYQKEFGKSDPFSTVIGHLDSMARDISSMEILGANPTATIRWMKDTLKKQGKLDDQKGLKRKKQLIPGRTNTDRMNVKTNLIEGIWGLHNGSLNAPVDGSISRSLAGVRQLLTAAQLGSASVLALGDFNFTRIAARFNGLDSVDAMFSNLKQMTKGLYSDELAELAMSSGLIAESFLTVGAAQARMMGDIFAPEMAKRINETVLRASGLSHMTQAGKMGFGMEFFRTISKYSDLKFDKLNPSFKNFFERNGIGEDGWNIIRSTKQYDHKGVKFIRPDDIFANENISQGVAKDLSDKLMDGINREIEFAVPSSSYRAKATLKGSSKPGTIGGELLLSVGMYKNFALTIAYTHIARMMFAKVNTFGGRAGYMTSFFITTMYIGAFTHELKNITKGKDVTKAENRDYKYWMNAAVHGGGLAIFGDFLYSSVNRFGGGIAKTLAGSPVSFAADTIELGIINPAKEIIDLFQEDDFDVNWGKDFANYTKRYSPGASLWYVRLAFERLIMDTLQEMTDPKFDKEVRRKEKALRKRTGQEYWWGAGNAKPDRPPEINPFK